MNIKVEEVSDAEEEADPVEKAVQEVKAEHENCTNSENTLVGPYGETYPTPHGADQATNVKAEAVSDAEEEEDPVPITFPEIKAEPECLTSKGNHKWYSTALRKMSSTALLKCGNNDENSVYVPKETVLKEMVDNMKVIRMNFNLCMARSNDIPVMSVENHSVKSKF
ncbi:uncharacterized protein LOC111870333 [Cryptotermes secundus]|uniref:uncharacterized protein LOC111870333 n=1 Tax=Cryptotermes secundus TaxID=105785 RepID=UPI000CD7BF26|nr:uncharacterized protein LOC111870333 [Cryptotermes secundus]